jgi:hypothetical protein
MRIAILTARQASFLLIGCAVWCAAFPPLFEFADAAGPPQQKVLDERKLNIAKCLTDWMQTQLLANKVLVAVVSRKGGKDLQSRDRTGMAHSGLAVYDPRAETWMLYQILNVPRNGDAVAELWRSAPVDFFYGQTGYEENALLLIPDDETQKRIYESVLSGDAWKLAFTPKYNLLSKYDSPDSLNCNKWILMAVAAARSQDYDPYHVLNVIHAGFEPARLHFNFLEKEVVKRKPNVRRSELPSYGVVQTVTPESLYRSGLFKERIFRTATALSPLDLR